jgi:hypothetical protein
MANDPEILVLELRRGIRAEIATLRDLPAQMTGLRGEMADLRSDLHSPRADVASNFPTLNAKIDSDNKATRDHNIGLRRAVIEYPCAAMGHGMLISELEARARPIKQHLNPPSMDAHRSAARVGRLQTPGPTARRKSEA